MPVQKRIPLWWFKFRARIDRPGNMTWCLRVLPCWPPKERHKSELWTASRPDRPFRFPAVWRGKRNRLGWAK